MFAVEHRYYGCHNLSSCPVPSFASPDDLRFLSSAQALEDLAHFVGYATAAYNLTGCQWVAWGGRCCCPLCLRPLCLALVLQAAATRALNPVFWPLQLPRNAGWLAAFKVSPPCARRRGLQRPRSHRG